ncbi:MAG: hypothetical protein CSA81_04790 [Acidobacteria bacterium]|nr:MAG: hypothetical protein CSA81_04790 [Acidobacteriota bacterium]PIE91093.1 MAG: hypothetical protein CR997_02945 [Acidobacteriota bacterium]
MTYDWESYLDGSMNHDERKELERELKKSETLREEMAKQREMDYLLNSAQQAFRLTCPPVSALADIMNGSRQASNRELKHLGHCHSCQNELKELVIFNESLSEAAEEERDPGQELIEKGRLVINAFKKGLVQLLEPSLSSLSAQPALSGVAFAHQEKNFQLPGLFIDSSVRGLLVSIENGCLKLGRDGGEDQPLVVTLTTEQGEEVREFTARGGVALPLEGVWHMEVRASDAAKE